MEDPHKSPECPFLFVESGTYTYCLAPILENQESLDMDYE